MKRLAAFFILLPLAMDFAGCKTCDRGKNAEQAAGVSTHSLKVETAYYVDGPQQARPPDGKLAAGTRVRVVRNEGSYSLVQTEASLTAYVSTDALEPLSR